MILSELIRDVNAVSIEGNPSTDIRSIEYDSRKAGPGTLFLAIRGHKTDGNVFIPEVMKRGAAAILTDQPAVTAAVGGAAAVVTVPDARKAMALVADRFYGSPQESLIMTGITGTNGKTTTSYLVRSIFETAGIGCGLIGTIRHLVGGETIDSLNTTPEAPDIHSFLARMAAAGQGACVMEVSSHALTLSRIHGIRYRAAAFTNLTRDHLDFHGDLMSYLDAKSILFSELSGDSTAVINGDDPSADHIKLVSRGGRVITFGFDSGNDMHPVSLELQANGSRAEVATPWGPLEVTLSLPGRFNVMNAMTAAGIALACGIPREMVTRGLTALRAVDGRFQTVEAGQDFSVIVDYAHTPDALERILAAAREITRGKLISVFGCGGDRDRGKRPLMGGISSRRADFSVVTSDNPRTEDPLAIIADITAGMNGTANYEVIPDRASAIRRALELAHPGDAVVIAGKGHEDYQIIGTARIHFDDAETAHRILKEKQ
jgi:UDP-N-acetylmuramoyl-L-alanyl-D-glutamate--2,6-diaminopimelate ligase